MISEGDRAGTSCQAGQAVVEVVAGIAVLMFVGLLAFQLLLVGHAHQLAEGAAHAGAVALTRGQTVKGAVERALPDWAASRHIVSRGPGSVRVTVRPPALDVRISRLLEVESTAWAKGTGP